MSQPLLFPQFPPRGASPLSPEQAGRVVALILKGASPAAACGPLGLDPLDVCKAADADPEFRTRLRHVRDLLTQNVAAAVYRAALEGTPAAQALWLRTFPPAAWADAAPPSHPVNTPDPETADVYDAFPTDDLARSLAPPRDRHAPEADDDWDENRQRIA